MKPDILLVEPMMQFIEDKLDAAYTVHRMYEPGEEASLEAALPRIRAVATGGGSSKDVISSAFEAGLPRPSQAFASATWAIPSMKTSSPPLGRCET